LRALTRCLAEARHLAPLESVILPSREGDAGEAAGATLSLVWPPANVASSVARAAVAPLVVTNGRGKLAIEQAVGASCEDALNVPFGADMNREPPFGRRVRSRPLCEFKSAVTPGAVIQRARNVSLDPFNSSEMCGRRIRDLLRGQVGVSLPAHVSSLFGVT
jgi:hypothetical protein